MLTCMSPIPFAAVLLQLCLPHPTDASQSCLHAGPSFQQHAWHVCPHCVLSMQVREGQLATAEGVSYLEAKYLLLLHYCIHLVFYILLKAEGRSVRDHPVIARLVEIRAFLERARPIDKRLRYQMDKLLAAAALVQVSQPCCKDGVAAHRECPPFRDVCVAGQDCRHFACISCVNFKAWQAGTPSHEPVSCHSIEFFIITCQEQFCPVSPQAQAQWLQALIAGELLQPGPKLEFSAQHENFACSAIFWDHCMYPSAAR